MVLGKGAVNPRRVITAKYLQDDILFWWTPRHLKRETLAPPILNRFIDELSELAVCHYASLSLRGGWDSAAMVSSLTCGHSFLTSLLFSSLFNMAPYPPLTDSEMGEMQIHHLSPVYNRHQTNPNYLLNSLPMTYGTNPNA